MKIPYIFMLFLLVLPMLAASAHAAGSPVEYPEDIAARLQLRYDAMKSLTFNFYQDIHGEMSGRPRQGSGHAVFYKHDGKARMRWDYDSPDRQVLISDGVLFSMYVANQQQMIITPAENIDTDLTYAFFTGKGSLQRDFHIRPANEDEQPENEAEFKVIKLIPKTPQSQVQDIHVWVTPESLIRRIKIQDHFGTITVLNLSDIATDSLVGKNTKEIDQIFAFTPPEGTEIIRQ